MMTRTLTALLSLLLGAGCVEVPVGSPDETSGAGNSLPPLPGAAEDDDNGDDEGNGDDDDDDASDDDDATEDDNGDDDASDDDDTTPAADDDDSTPVGGDDDDTTPAPTPTGDVSWWYRTENSVQYDEMIAFGWSWYWQVPGDTDCSDCYVLLGIFAYAVEVSGGVAQQSELAALPEGTIVSFNVGMMDDGDEDWLWSCQNGAPSGVLRVWWGAPEQTVCTDDWGDGCSRAVKLGQYNCNWI